MLIVKKDLLFFFSFSLSIFIFSLFSTPTPQYFTWVELLSGFLLFFCFCISGLEFLNHRNNTWMLWFVFIFFYFLMIPTTSSILSDVTFFNFFRDYVSILFLFLFLLFSPVTKLKTNLLLKITANLLSFMGLIFSVRYLLLDKVDILNFSYFTIGSNDYFSADSSVVFATIYFFIEGMKSMLKNKKTISIFYTFFGFLCLLAILLTGFRLQSTLFILSFIFSFILYYLCKPNKLFLFYYIFIFVVLLINSKAKLIINLLVTKQINLGINSRDVEFTVVEQINTLYEFFFGLGWGSFIYSAMNDYSPVRFIHSYILYFYIKSGFLGCIFAVTLIFFSYKVLFVSLLRSLRNFKSLTSNTEFPVILASGSSLTYCFFFSGAFKSLSMGMLLILVSCLHYNLKKNNLDNI